MHMRPFSFRRNVGGGGVLNMISIPEYSECTFKFGTRARFHKRVIAMTVIAIT